MRKSFSPFIAIIVCATMLVACGHTSVREAAPAAPASSASSGPLPAIDVFLPRGWTIGRHPVLYHDGEHIVYVNESTLSQVSVWLVPEGQKTLDQIARELNDASPAEPSRGTWHGLRWYAIRDAGASEFSSALAMTREMGGTRTLVAMIGIWPKGRPAMAADALAIMSHLYVLGTPPIQAAAELIPVSD